MRASLFLLVNTGRAVDSRQVLESEESGEKVLHNDERSRQKAGKSFQAFDDDKQYAD